MLRMGPALKAALFPSVDCPLPYLILVSRFSAVTGCPIRALKETIIRIKQNAINYRSEHMDPTDLSAMTQVLEDRKALQQLEKLHISIN